MALSGLHVVCAFAGGPGSQQSPQALMSIPQWSQTLSSDGMTSKSAVANVGPLSTFGQPIFRIYASVDAWVSTGPTPDTTGVTAARFLVPASTTYDVFVGPGDFLAWAAA